MRDRTSHIHPDAERINTASLIMGIAGFAGFCFALGRTGRGGEECCDQLVRRDLELIRLQQALALGQPPLPW